MLQNKKKSSGEVEKVIRNSNSEVLVMKDGGRGEKKMGKNGLINLVSAIAFCEEYDKTRIYPVLNPIRISFLVILWFIDFIFKCVCSNCNSNF